MKKMLKNTASDKEKSSDYISFLTNYHKLEAKKKIFFFQRFILSQF